MNKHQYRAVLTAILALCASFALWTLLVSTLTMTNESTTHVEEEISIDDLGEHYGEAVEKERVTASILSPEPSHEPSTVDDAAPQPLSEPHREKQSEPTYNSAASLPSDLEQWELMRAWRITIPSLGIRAPVLLPSMKYWSQQAWDMLEEQMQIGLSHGTVAYPHSVNPGRNGSLIIAGHSSPPDERAERSTYGSIFARLPDVELGEEIEVESAGTLVRYRVDDKQIVTPQMTTILAQQDDESVLKLITCYPVGTTRNRMIITATKIVD